MMAEAQQRTAELVLRRLENPTHTGSNTHEYM
jgi:hypothetical protein